MPEEWQKIWLELREVVRYRFLNDPYSVPRTVAMKLDVTGSYYYKYGSLSIVGVKKT